MKNVMDKGDNQGEETLMKEDANKNLPKKPPDPPPEPSTYSCDKCYRIFKSEKELREHLGACLKLQKDESFLKYHTRKQNEFNPSDKVLPLSQVLDSDIDSSDGLLPLNEDILPQDESINFTEMNTTEKGTVPVTENTQIF